MKLARWLPLLAVATVLTMVAAGDRTMARSADGMRQPVAAASRTPDLRVLFRRATRLVRHAKPRRYSRAVMLEAFGWPADGHAATTAAGLDRWRFLLDNRKSRTRYRTAMVAFAPRTGFGKVRGSRDPFLGDHRLPRPPAMTLAAAVALLRGAGYRGGFYNVTLRAPLVDRGTAPLYVFSMDGHVYIAVNTATRAVGTYP